ncbi:major facilitator superfamily domain-containing protein [Trichoderma breve]|uniref:Major facilitator superfamily domain-containing protein n=1 Tax=Trichoderma breve TaxID=2034170 RepID=A0A9W9BAX8_9HYPO|nr:major facilitator superfamily domain-containing protein [Trichoderma breve]KAJ4859898.1 major facilitator superfamily domain-containing protein [Trichoderma breve]
MYETFRESALGQAIRFVSRNKLLQYPEERPDFVLPPDPDPASDSSQTADEDGEDLSRERTQIELKKTKSEPIVPQKTNDGVILVDWYTTDDPANPHNWSSFKRSYIVFVICLYTWVTYVAGSVFAFSEPGIVEHFGVSVEASELGLALYVLAYGVGPLIFGPLTEIPVIGRNPVYYLTFLVFFALSFPAATINSFGGLLAVRFFAGFFGSVGIAIGGPAIGPTFAGFAAMEKGWRWPLWEVVWICAVMAIFLLALTPETSAPNILLRRAKRLRKLTGDARLQSQSEIDQRHLSGSAVLIAALIRPFEITIKDPSIFFVNLYTALTYAIYFTFFEVFPLVFPPFYGFNLGQTGLAFLACEVGSILALILYFAYLHFYMIPDNIKNGFREQEHRLLPAIFGSVVLPIGLFIFAWTARASIHWIVPLIGVTIFVLGQYMVIQGLFMYVPVSYPQYAASIFTGNDLIRSAVATGCILAARPMFINLGVHKGVTVLAGLSIMGIIGTLLMYKYGKTLRAKSKFAQA